MYYLQLRNESRLTQVRKILGFILVVGKVPKFSILFFYLTAILILGNYDICSSLCCVLLAFKHRKHDCRRQFRTASHGGEVRRIKNGIFCDFTPPRSRSRTVHISSTFATETLLKISRFSQVCLT